MCWVCGHGGGDGLMVILERTVLGGELYVRCNGLSGSVEMVDDSFGGLSGLVLAAVIKRKACLYKCCFRVGYVNVVVV